MSNKSDKLDAKDTHKHVKQEFVLITIGEFCVFVSQHGFQLLTFTLRLKKAIICGDFHQTLYIEETTSKFGDLFPEDYRVGHYFSEYGKNTLILWRENRLAYPFSKK